MWIEFYNFLYLKLRFKVVGKYKLHCIMQISCVFVKTCGLCELMLRMFIMLRMLTRTL